MPILVTGEPHLEIYVYLSQAPGQDQVNVEIAPHEAPVTGPHWVTEPVPLVAPQLATATSLAHAILDLTTRAGTA